MFIECLLPLHARYRAWHSTGTITLGFLNSSLRVMLLSLTLKCEEAETGSGGEGGNPRAHNWVLIWSKEFQICLIPELMFLTKIYYCFYQHHLILITEAILNWGERKIYIVWYIAFLLSTGLDMAIGRNFQISFQVLLFPTQKYVVRRNEK